MISISRLCAVACVALLSTGAAGASAAARPDTRAMTCEQARAFVRQNGAVVMSTGQYTYERFVAGFGYCEADEEPWLQVAPTLDNSKCRVGNICRTRIIEHDNFPLWRQR